MWGFLGGARWSWVKGEQKPEGQNGPDCICKEPAIPEAIHTLRDPGFEKAVKWYLHLPQRHQEAGFGR